MSDKDEFFGIICPECDRDTCVYCAKEDAYAYNRCIYCGHVGTVVSETLSWVHNFTDRHGNNGDGELVKQVREWMKHGFPENRRNDV